MAGTLGRLIASLAVTATVASSIASAECKPPPASLATPTALVLSGGGAKGAWEAGAAAALVESRLPIRVVAGSSAGALNAVMVADGRLDRLEAVWRSLTNDRVYALRPSVVLSGLLPGWLGLLTLHRAGALLDPGPLRALLAAWIDLARVRASAVRVLVVASDLARRDKRVFDNETLTLEALMAAVAVPGVFPPVAVDGALLVDGGVIGRAPVLEALESGVRVDRAIVVMSYAPDERGGAPTTIRRAVEEAFETAMIHQIRRDVELARLKYPEVQIDVLTPSEPLGLRPLDFEPPALAGALARGRADARRCLGG